ncbi:hypothetical protein AHAS_Ahas08G0138300 [Arachis hypogaea]
MKKQGSIATKYLQKIKNVVHALASNGHVLSLEDRISSITDGLFEDYAFYISSVMTKADSINLIEAETLVLAHERMYDRFRKTEFGSIQANLTQSTPQFPSQFQRNFNGRRGCAGRFTRGGRTCFNDS